MMPNNYDYLLRYFHQTKNKEVGEAIKITLKKMAFGGLYDVIGGGFARYSVDAQWKVPHFEKMLYDNGQLLTILRTRLSTYQTSHVQKRCSKNCKLAGT